METIAITSQAPVMPTAWPQSEHIRPVKRRLPNTVDAVSYTHLTLPTT